MTSSIINLIPNVYYSIHLELRLRSGTNEMGTLKISPSQVSNVSCSATSCCGIHELDGLNINPWINLARIYKGLYPNRYEMVIFTDVTVYDRDYYDDDYYEEDYNGNLLAETINKYKLGKLQESDEVNNPNTDNTIRLWIFYPDWKVMNVIFKSYRQSRTFEITLPTIE